MPPRHDTPFPRAAALSDADLDAILAIQLSVAWAGETVPGENRFGWWRTELTDPDAGGDFLARLLPRTHAWAGLTAAREAARRVDAAARRASGNPDAVCSLFHFGFALDERLDARLAALRQAGTPPRDSLAAQLVVRDRFDRAAFTDWLEGLARDAATVVVPNARQLEVRPASPVDAAQRLAAALRPIAPVYPLPFFPMVGA